MEEVTSATAWLKAAARPGHPNDGSKTEADRGWGGVCGRGREAGVSVCFDQR